MRFASYVLYTVRSERSVALCISEVAPGLIEVRRAGEAGMWAGRLTRAETAEVAAGLARDRAALSGARLEAA